MKAMRKFLWKLYSTIRWNISLSFGIFLENARIIFVLNAAVYTRADFVPRERK